MMDNSRLIFGFEEPFARGLRCIPMAVRYMLDTVGVKLGLEQWRKMDAASRQALLDRFEAQGAGGEFDRLLRETLALLGEEAREMPPPSSPAWRDGDRVPAEVEAHYREARRTGLKAAEGGESLEEKWKTLSPLQRFALVKLSRPGHENRNFIPCLREFGLLPA